jgi:hypothetical protein
MTTQVCFEELDKVAGISHDTARILKLDWSKSVYPVENGVFVAALPADSGKEAAKRRTSASVMLSKRRRSEPSPRNLRNLVATKR